MGAVGALWAVWTSFWHYLGPFWVAFSGLFGVSGRLRKHFGEASGGSGRGPGVSRVGLGASELRLGGLLGTS